MCRLQSIAPVYLRYTQFSEVSRMLGSNVSDLFTYQGWNSTSQHWIDAQQQYIVMDLLVSPMEAREVSFSPKGAEEIRMNK